MSKAKQSATTREENEQVKRYKRAAAVTVPTLSIAEIKEGESLFVEFRDEIKTKEQTDKEGQVKMENGKPVLIHTARVVNLATGELGDMVVPFIVHRDLEELGNYVGKKYELVKGPKKGRMNVWTVFELADGE